MRKLLLFALLVSCAGRKPARVEESRLLHVAKLGEQCSHHLKCVESTCTGGVCQ